MREGERGKAITGRKGGKPRVRKEREREREAGNCADASSRHQDQEIGSRDLSSAEIPAVDKATTTTSTPIMTVRAAPLDGCSRTQVERKRGEREREEAHTQREKEVTSKKHAKKHSSFHFTVRRRRFRRRRRSLTHSLSPPLLPSCLPLSLALTSCVGRASRAVSDDELHRSSTISPANQAALRFGTQGMGRRTAFCAACLPACV